MPDIPELPSVIDDSRFTWSEVEPGFYVGSFIGYVDHTSGDGFFAYDMKSQLIGAFEALNLAMMHLTEIFLHNSEEVEYPRLS